MRLKNVCSVAPKKPAPEFTREATVLTVVLNCTNRDLTADADARNPDSENDHATPLLCGPREGLPCD